VNKQLHKFTNSSELWFLMAALYTSRGATSDIEIVLKCYFQCLQIGDSTEYDSVVGTGSYLAAHNVATLLELLGDQEMANEFYQHEEGMRKQTKNI
jgi:hypothetical protein